MAHKYNNFNEAYTHLCDNWGFAYLDWGYYQTNLDYAYAAMDAGNALGACNSLINAGRNLTSLLKFVLDFYDAACDQSSFMECFYWAAQEGGDGEITWKAIVEAWIKNDFEGRAPTIAVIDRMRQILWDEPFRITWAARPENEIE